MNNNILIEKLLSTDFKGSADYISGARDGMYTLDRNLPSPTGDRDCEELKEALRALIPLAEDGKKLHISNACHHEFLLEDSERISKAKQLLNL